MQPSRAQCWLPREQRGPIIYASPLLAQIGPSRALFPHCADAAGPQDQLPGGQQRLVETLAPVLRRACARGAYEAHYAACILAARARSKLQRRVYSVLLGHARWLLGPEQIEVQNAPLKLSVDPDIGVSTAEVLDTGGRLVRQSAVTRSHGSGIGADGATHVGGTGAPCCSPIRIVAEAQHSPAPTGTSLSPLVRMQSVPGSFSAKLDALRVTAILKRVFCSACDRAAIIARAGRGHQIDRSRKGRAQRGRS